MPMTSPSVLPSVPVKHADFIEHVSAHPDNPLTELLKPYKQYDAKLREIFAQEPRHPALADEHLNVVPIFSGSEQYLKVRSRDLDSESAEEKERYVLSLDASERRASGTPAVVESINEFKQNFALFSESSLVDLDWSNVVAAGSSVVTSLLPVPGKYKKSKRALRQYYHEMLAPASDVDLFLYGLTEDDAVKKIVEIEQRVKDSILTETTTIRTKNAITIASQYPTRHIQIVLRIYKSVSEILTGFDVDCSCAAYDGKQVWAAPRALTAYMTQVNTIDLTRRSPSYENRLSKYSHRGFEVYWPLLERSRIDPTIFERNFARTVGLARLLVLERLPSKTEREAYMDERRRERGRPAINRPYRHYPSQGNIKDKYEDEVAEWVSQEDVSDYHTFTIPYGPKYFARKIEKLLYSKDLLLNAEWNKKGDREVYLHRHPAFFGYAGDIIHDCCGFCPKPVTPEEHEVAEQEAKIYVSGEISFIKDDAGRQAIGSFHPITDDDWTDMAYIGNTARLCQAIVDQDLEHVEDWLSQEGSDPDCRDYTGRTPLHLAVVSSSLEIVRALIDHGARLVARLADGRTALHLAAARGNVDMVKLIMHKSEENEDNEAKKEDIRKQARIAARKVTDNPTSDDGNQSVSESEDLELDIVDKDEEADDEAHSTTSGYLKVKGENENSGDVVPEEGEEGPDVYDVNVVTWDTKASPLHLAIMNGHTEVVKELVETFGADVLLPIKLFNSHDRSPRGAILPLVLSLSLPLDQAKLMTKTLLNLGASSAQADTKQATALHYISEKQPELLEMLFDVDEPAAKRAINHLSVSSSSWTLPTAKSPLMSAILNRNALGALKLLAAGADTTIDFTNWVKAVGISNDNVLQRTPEQNKTYFEHNMEQPIILAVQNELPEVAFKLLELGADPNTLPKQTKQKMSITWRKVAGETLLDTVRETVKSLRQSTGAGEPYKPSLTVKEGFEYLAGIEEGSYAYFVAKTQLNAAKSVDEASMADYERRVKLHNERRGVVEKDEALDALAKEFEKFEELLLGKGAKTFKELYPDHESDGNEEKQHGLSPPPSPPEVFKVEFSFNVHNQTDEMREAYMRLFQAVWDGDLKTVKSLTLASWGPNNNTPLKLAVEDRKSNNPFCIAVLRGHYELARALVDISYTQYQQPEDNKNKRYRIASEDDDDDDGASDTSDVEIYAEIVDDRFTIENIGELPTQVKSTTNPLQFMASLCPAWDYVKMFLADKKYIFGVDDRKVEGFENLGLKSWAIMTNDKPLFAFLLDLDVEWTDRLAKVLDGSSGIPSFTHYDFRLAIDYGRVELLAEMIKHAGAGIELESLVNKSGVKYHEKPKYYQGLSVHGKKRSDWVNAAKGTAVRNVYDTNPPLLQAAFAGSLQSVEWFLSDAPIRHYLDFAEAYKNDKFIRHLNESAGGFEKVLRTWLGARRELALHCAVMAVPREETTKLIKYLLQVMPDSLEYKSAHGLTPLAIAISLRRLDTAKLLIEAGADQTVRTYDGRNILHLLLSPAYKRSAITDSKILQPFLDLIDKRLIPSLLTERCSDEEPSSCTPIASWLRKSTEGTDVLRTLLDFAASTNNEHLELLDGSGDTPLHYMVNVLHQSWFELALEYRPDLLYRENSVGRTPYELAEDAYISECAGNSPWAPRINTIVAQPAETFARDYKKPANVNKESVWRACQERLGKAEGNQKRRLVSLIEANEVAKRLAGRNKKSSYDRRRVGDADLESDAGGEEGRVQKEDVMDEVSQWHNQALSMNAEWIQGNVGRFINPSLFW